ncbi:Tuberculostearic acid methyltransferase UfaA1 [Pararobbsia alpina]|uniref:class I SAM-dependent methyltransferase n=1 Tax=Pararobbsia alpina TaxID=621374 RepID=UPI0039A77DF2
MTLLHAFGSPSAMPLSARVFFSLMSRIRHGHVTVMTPDGMSFVFGDPHQHPSATLEIRDWRACGAILRAGDIGFAEAYREGWIDSNDLAAVLIVAIRNIRELTPAVTGARISQLWYALRHRLRINSKAGSRRNIHAHYDIGNAFYALWLDPTWTYSSAWFNGDATLSLEAAQNAKYQRIIDTLGLRAGMHVLEIGCGWGGFAVHAARQGIYVHALTISSAQFESACARVSAEGVSKFVEIELRDYRDVAGEYDAIVSIEMFEAVGEAYWPIYFGTLSRCLAPGARALIQSITIDEAQFTAYRHSSDFIREYIFPGGMLPSPERLIGAAERAGLCAETTLTFGVDYAQTLRHWHAAFEARLDEVRALGFDERFVRTWRLYLKYCEAGFVEGRTDVVHCVVQRPAR